MDRLMQMEDADEREAARLTPPEGWEEFHTGGGCMAWRKEAPRGKYWIATTTDDAAMPEADEAATLGLYDDTVEGNEGFLHMHFKTGQALVDFLTNTELELPGYLPGTLYHAVNAKWHRYIDPDILGLEADCQVAVDCIGVINAAERVLELAADTRDEVMRAIADQCRVFWRG